MCARVRSGSVGSVSCMAMVGDVDAGAGGLGWLDGGGGRAVTRARAAVWSCIGGRVIVRWVSKGEGNRGGTGRALRRRGGRSDPKGWRRVAL